MQEIPTETRTVWAMAVSLSNSRARRRIHKTRHQLSKQTSRWVDGSKVGTAAEVAHQMSLPPMVGIREAMVGRITEVAVITVVDKGTMEVIAVMVIQARKVAETQVRLQRRSVTKLSHKTRHVIRQTMRARRSNTCNRCRQMNRATLVLLVIPHQLRWTTTPTTRTIMHSNNKATVLEWNNTTRNSMLLTMPPKVLQQVVMRPLLQQPNNSSSNSNSNSNTVTSTVNSSSSTSSNTQATIMVRAE